jgi:hypothetical protein
MEEDQNGIRNQQSDSKPNKSSAENSKDIHKGTSNDSPQAAVEENSTFQRRPQFRITENCKKRYI